MYTCYLYLPAEKKSFAQSLFWLLPNQKGLVYGEDNWDFKKLMLKSKKYTIFIRLYSLQYTLINCVYFYIWLKLSDFFNTLKSRKQRLYFIVIISQKLYLCWGPAWFNAISIRFSRFRLFCPKTTRQGKVYNKVEEARNPLWYNSL